MKKKDKIHKIKYCLLLSSLFIFSGCSSTGSKKEKILRVQNQRIQNLESLLKKKNREIARLKQTHWLRKKKTEKSHAFKKLQTAIQNRQWAAALQQSAYLKKRYPRSHKLKKMRIHIFESMGLFDQAEAEKRLSLQGSPSLQKERSL